MHVDDGLGNVDELEFIASDDLLVDVIELCKVFEDLYLDGGML